MLQFHTWFVMTIYYKMQQILSQNAIAVLLQNATEVYYKMLQIFLYKMRQLLQNATFITNCNSAFYFGNENLVCKIWKNNICL